MKKLTLIFGIVAAQLISAQATRFVYQASSTPDSAKLGERKTELVYLDTDGQKSKFYSENRMKRDSLMDRMRQTRTFDPSQMENFRSSIEYTIEKDLQKQSITYKERIARDQYAYTETPNFSWKILPETVKIGEYQTQKAETIYGGRTWYAWFTQDVPLQDGPYKFGGLPGLIVKVQDSKDQYSFDLMQTKKIEKINEPQTRGQSITITKDKFVDTQKKFKKDPTSFMNNSRSGGPSGPGGGMRPGGGFGGPGGGNGPTAQDRQRMQDMQKRMIDELKNNNNPIELSLK